MFKSIVPFGNLTFCDKIAKVPDATTDLGKVNCTFCQVAFAEAMDPTPAPTDGSPAPVSIKYDRLDLAARILPGLLRNAELDETGRVMKAFEYADRLLAYHEKTRMK
jgi:hypothetical protein